MNEQHTLGWYRDRLGKITGSRVGVLMKKGKKSEFTEEAMSYIYQLAAERAIAKRVLEDDLEFEAYINATTFETKAMRFGTETEATARDAYSFQTGEIVKEVGACLHFDIPNFASSPDGITESNASIEIKCPTQSTFMKYCHRIFDAASLLIVNPDYYYQCMAHIMCANTIRTDFIVFSPFQERDTHIIPVYPDDFIFKMIEERITLANQLIDDIVSSQQKLNILIYEQKS